MLEEEEVKGLWRVWSKQGNDSMESSGRKREMEYVSSQERL